MAEVLYQLHWADYLVFVLFMMITPAIGIFFALSGGRQRTTKEYFSGDGKLGVFPAAMSIVVSYMSAIMTLGVPAETFLYGGHYLLASIGSTLACVVAMYVFVPVFYPLKLISVNKYVEMRYQSKLPKYIGTAQAVSIGILYSALVIFAPSSAIATMMGIPVWIVILVSCAVAIFYTTIGGIKAVIWTDTFQCFCMLGGLLAIIVQGIRYSGGVSNVWELNVEGGRLDIFNFDPNPVVRLTVWNMVFALGFDCIATYGYSQSAVMRYANVESLQKARLTLLLCAVGNIFMYVLPVFAGLSIYGYYASLGCDPISDGTLDNPNQLVPYFVMETLNYPGVPGLFLASLSAGALSSVSSALNSTAGNIWGDVLKPCFPHVSSHKGAIISKVVVVVLGCIATGFCYLITFLGGTLIQISYAVAGVVLVPFTGMTFLGVVCPWINTKGIVTGSLIGFAVVFWIGTGQFMTFTYEANTLPMVASNCTEDYLNVSEVVTTNSPPTPFMFTSSNYTESQVDSEGDSFDFLGWMYSVSYIWYRTIGVFIMFIVGTLVSLITGHKKISGTESRLICFCYKNCADQYDKSEDSHSWTLVHQKDIQLKLNQEKNSLLKTAGKSSI